MVKSATKAREATRRRGCLANTGDGRRLQPIDIGHPDYAAVIEPDTAFWALVKRSQLADFLGRDRVLLQGRQTAGFEREMEELRFGLKPSAVYFNPTERCNLNCAYCYIPEKMRRTGSHMSETQLLDALAVLKRHFRATLPAGARPEIVFHGAEPLLNRAAIFAGIEKYGADFRFGIQTNATLLDDEVAAFLISRNVSIGISLDGPTAAIADLARRNWAGQGVYERVIAAMERLDGYPNWSVIATLTTENMKCLVELVDFFHEHRVPTCLINTLRCTLRASRDLKPSDAEASRYFLAALDRTHELYSRTGRKLVVANFANTLLAIIAPTARRLMCDISPCGGGRCFFAVTPNGDIFPCSEFIGLPRFRGGNLFKGGVSAALRSKAFRVVVERKIEVVESCRDCAIRHFCGSPCPAEAHEMNGGMDQKGAFCEFYEEQVRYAFRAIADKKADDYLWDGWDEGLKDTFNI